MSDGDEVWAALVTDGDRFFLVVGENIMNANIVGWMSREDAVSFVTGAAQILDLEIK